MPYAVLYSVMVVFLRGRIFFIYIDLHIPYTLSNSNSNIYKDYFFKNSILEY